MSSYFVKNLRKNTPLHSLLQTKQELVHTLVAKSITKIIENRKLKKIKTMKHNNQYDV